MNNSHAPNSGHVGTGKGDNSRCTRFAPITRGEITSISNRSRTADYGSNPLRGLQENPKNPEDDVMSNYQSYSAATEWDLSNCP